MPQAETQQPQEITVDQFADSFKKAVERGDEHYVSFANEMGTKYKGLGRKLSKEELVQEFVTKYPDFQQSYKVKDLPTLGAIAPPPPSPSGPPQPNDHKQGLKSGPGSGILTPILEGARSTVRKGAAAITGAIPKIATLGHSAPGVNEFAAGFGEGIADTGIDMTSPVNIGLAAGTFLIPEALVAKAPKAIGLLKKIASYGFSGAQGIDALKELGVGAEAYQSKDYRAMGRAAAKTLADAAMIKASATSRKKTGAAQARGMEEIAERKADKTKIKTDRERALASEPQNPAEPPTRTGAERFNESLAKRAVGSRGHEGAVREIGNLQDAINAAEKMPRGTAAHDKIPVLESRIRELMATLPEEMRDPRLVEQNAAKGQPIPKTEKQPPLPPASPSGQPAVTSAAQKARLDAAHKRSTAPREPVPGLGYRLAAEEVGEIPAQAKPAYKPVKSEEQPPPARHATIKVPEGPDFERSINPEGKAYTANKMPGIPAGAKVIPRGLTPQGFVVDVLDSSGRMNQKVLPFHDSLPNMVEKGWLKPTDAPTETFREPLPGDPPSGPTKASKADDPAARTKTSPESRALPAPGPSDPIPGVTPFQPLQPGNPPSGPKGLLQEPPLRLEPQPQMSHEDQVALARTQPPEVVQNFIDKTRSAFAEKTKGLPKKAVDQFTVKLDEYLRPFEEVANPSAKAAPGKAATSERRPAETSQNPPAAPASSNIGQAPEPVQTEVQNIIQSAVRRAGGEGWQRITVTPVGSDLKTPIGDPVTLPFDQFTPDAVWAMVQKAGAEGIEVFNPDNKMRDGIVRRPIRATPMEPPGRF